MFSHGTRRPSTDHVKLKQLFTLYQDNTLNQTYHLLVFHSYKHQLLSEKLPVLGDPPMKGLGRIIHEVNEISLYTP